MWNQYYEYTEMWLSPFKIQIQDGSSSFVSKCVLPCVSLSMNVGSEGGGGAVRVKSQLLNAEGFVWQ